MTTKKFDPETCQYSIEQAQNLCTAIKDYLEDVSSQAEACKKNPCDEVAFAIIARGAVDRVEIWQTLLSQLTDQLNDADTNLQIAVDNLYHKGGE